MIDRLLEDYKQLQKQMELPPLEAVSVLVERQVLASDNVEAAVSILVKTQGWLRRQSQVYRTPNESAESVAGLPLSGEWLVAESQSKHLRQDGKGGWLLYHYRQFKTPDESENAKKEGGNGVVHDCLAEKITLLAADSGSKLAYRVYWGGEDGNIRRLFGRFAGFEPDARQKGEQRS